MGFSFFLSGVLHSLADMIVGLSVWETGSWVFFTVQTLGIWLEDTFIDIYEMCTKSNEQKDDKEKQKARPKPAAWKKSVGYVWMILWLTWSTPFMVFPAWRHGSEGALSAHVSTLTSEYL